MDFLAFFVSAGDWAEDALECLEPSVASELLITLAALWVGEDKVLLLAPGEETSCGKFREIKRCKIEQIWKLSVRNDSS